MAREAICGIYKITNLVNGKVYIGLSKHILTRWIEHKSHYKTIDSVLYCAMRKYGLDNFSFEILEECNSEELSEREKFYIQQYRSYVGFEDCKGYNATLGGEDSSGMIITQETRMKLSLKRQLGSNPAAKKVYVNDRIFGTIKEAAHFLGVSAKNLQRWLSRTRRISKDNSHLLQYKIGFVGEEPINQDTFGTGTAVECDGIKFVNIKDCAKYLNISYQALLTYLKGSVCAPSSLKNRGLKYVNKDSSLKFRDEFHYAFVCDEKYFENISSLCNYLHCPKSSIYNHVRKNNKNIFVYRNKQIMWKKVSD